MSGCHLELLNLDFHWSSKIFYCFRIR